MASSLFPLQYLIAAFGLFLNRQQQEVIHYLKEENRSHQGMNNRLLNSAANDESYNKASTSKRAQLGNILNYYYREAA